MMKNSPCAVCACLLGVKCRYDGRTSRVTFTDGIPPWSGREVLAVCPEVAGGLEIPREPCEIVGEKVISCSGRDCTAEYVRGAEICADMIRDRGIKDVYLKSRSPSCGMGMIYDGSFSGRLRAGDGVFVATLKRLGGMNLILCD